MKLMKNSIKDEESNSQNSLDKSSTSQGLYMEKPKNGNNLDLLKNENKNFGIQEIYSYCQKDFAQIGYEDALKNPDKSHQDEAVRKIKIDLQILIAKTGTYYEDLLDQIDLHIDMRKQNGLVDLVMELESRKKQIARHIEKVNEIHNQSYEENKITEGVILSYNKGFALGLSAISHLEIINKIQ